MISASDILHARILIVDDQAANVLLLERMLRGAGYDSVTSTMKSVEVCELHLLNHYDLILLDLQMPGMDGFQVMENLKAVETGGYLPVLVITAQPDHKLRALKAGAKDFVSKPLDLAEVLIRVHNMLEVRLLHVETRDLYNRVLAEKKVSERLVNSLLPGALVERLKARPDGPASGDSGLVAESYAEVTALFADVVEFTEFAEGASAEVLLGVLGEGFAGSRGVTGDGALERDRIIGDAYLAGVGLSDATAARTIRASHKALDLIGALARFNAHSRYKLKVRIGLEAGDEVTGVVRKRKKKTVNL